jgi:hypothetical protein
MHKGVTNFNSKSCFPAKGLHRLAKKSIFLKELIIKQLAGHKGEKAVRLKNVS